MSLHLYDPAGGARTGTLDKPGLTARDADRLLARLDVEPCGCRLQWEQDDEDADAWHLLKCPHVTAAPDHSLSIAEWAELQRLLCPADYTDPPEPEAPAVALTVRARVSVYRQRVESDPPQHLYHGADLWRQDDGRKVAVLALHAPNGATYGGGLTGGRPAAAPLVAELLAAMGPLARGLFERGERLLATQTERRAAA